MTLHDIWTRDHAADFAAGVRLLAEHGGERFLTRLAWQRLQALAAGGDYIDRYNTGKLEHALHQCVVEAGKSPTPKDQPPAPKDQRPATKDQPPTTSEAAKALHKEHAHEHALMVTAPTDAERAAPAAKIMEEIVPALDKEYDRLKEGASPIEGVKVDNTGLAPILNAASAADYKKLQSVRSRISTLKKKIKAAKTPKDKAKWEAELAVKIAERERLESAIG